LRETVYSQSFRVWPLSKKNWIRFWWRKPQKVRSVGEFSNILDTTRHGFREKNRNCYTLPEYIRRGDIGRARHPNFLNTFESSSIPSLWEAEPGSYVSIARRKFARSRLTPMADIKGLDWPDMPFPGHTHTHTHSSSHKVLNLIDPELLRHFRRPAFFSRPFEELTCWKIRKSSVISASNKPRKTGLSKFRRQRKSSLNRFQCLFRWVSSIIISKIYFNLNFKIIINFETLGFFGSSSLRLYAKLNFLYFISLS